MVFKYFHRYKQFKFIDDVILLIGESHTISLDEVNERYIKNRRYVDTIWSKYYHGDFDENTLIDLISEALYYS